MKSEADGGQVADEINSRMRYFVDLSLQPQNQDTLNILIEHAGGINSVLSDNPKLAARVLPEVYNDE